MPGYAKSTLQKVIRPFSTFSEVVCTETFALSTVTGSPSIVMRDAVGIFSQYDFRRLASLVDFTQQTDSYSYFKVEAIKLELVRSADEATMFANLRGSAIYINYYPDLYSTAISYGTLASNELSYQIDLMTFSRQTVICPPEKLDCVVAAPVDLITINLKNVMPVTFCQYLPGQISVAAGNTVNNAANLNLFSLKIVFKLKFFYRA
jgi:hypothetical protein